MTQLMDINVPDLGSAGALAVIELLVKPGDPIEVGTPLITLESDKATMDVPSPVAGQIEELLVQRGSKVATGDLIARVQPNGGAAARSQVRAATSASTAPASPTPAPLPPVAAALTRESVVQVTPAMTASTSTAVPPAAQPPAARADAGLVHAGPAVRRLARELGIDLAAAQGSARRGRWTPADVKAYAKARLLGASDQRGPVAGSALPALPRVDFAAFGPVETRPLSRIQRISGPRLHASWVNLPHVTQFDEADITDLESLRIAQKPKAEAAGIKLTLLAFVLRACVVTLKRFPKFNSSLTPDAQSLVYKNYIHLGFAADTPNGLLVPVVRDADRLDVYRIARRLTELSERARAGKLQGADLQGGSFTVTSLGGIGGAAFTPIINAPEVAILGASRATMKPVWQGDRFVPRLILPLSLSYDHRVIDGADGARFTSALREALADGRGLLEAVPQ